MLLPLEFEDAAACAARTYCFIRLRIKHIEFEPTALPICCRFILSAAGIHMSFRRVGCPVPRRLFLLRTFRRACPRPSCLRRLPRATPCRRHRLPPIQMTMMSIGRGGAYLPFVCCCCCYTSRQVRFVRCVSCSCSRLFMVVLTCSLFSLDRFVVSVGPTPLCRPPHAVLFGLDLVVRGVDLVSAVVVTDTAVTVAQGRCEALELVRSRASP